MKLLDDITGEIVDAAMRIHVDLGPGLLETVYEAVLARALERRGLVVERQRPVSFEFDGLVFEEGFRVDLVVDNRVVIELKSVEKLAPVHSKQLLTYLRLMKLPVGLLINFGAPTLKEGLHRFVNGLVPERSPGLRVNQTRGGRGGGRGKSHAEARRARRRTDMKGMLPAAFGSCLSPFASPREPHSAILNGG